MRPNILMPIMTFMTRYYHSSTPPCRSVSVSNHLFKVFLLTLFVNVTFMVSSCEEGPTKIGIGLLPGSDNVETEATDTLSVWSYTMYNDSVRSDIPLYSYLGQIYDPYFGTTSAEFVSEIRLKPAWDDKPFTIDSVKLVLKLLEVKGKSDVPHTLRLSEIANQIFTDSAYYSNRAVDTTGFGITLVLPVLKPDTINNVVMTLPVEFGNYLTRDTAKLFYSNTKADFRSFFKGLYFRITSVSDPMIVTISLQPPTTGESFVNYFVLYMHDTLDLQKKYYFILDATNTNASYNRFSHDFNTALPGKKIEHINDMSFRDTLSYLQYLNGVYTKIVFPGLESLKNDSSFDKIAVNKARLTVPLFFDGDLYKPSSVPSSLRLRYTNKSGVKYDVQDYYVDELHSFFDGKVDTTANLYNFNIASFVQAYLDDTKDDLKPELEIFQVSGTRNAIFRANTSKTPVKFEFTYTKF
jgi:hypothetical protein